MVTQRSIQEGLAYIKTHKAIRDVLLSGGDPLLLEDRKLRNILAELRGISHVEIIRIGTRVPCTLPLRIDGPLVEMLKEFHPLYVHTHFNHPSEITPESSGACNLLADAGIPLGCQTVLLRGVNDHPDTMTRLMRGLLKIRVRPYYLFQADLAKGTAHFWTPLTKGLDIINHLQRHVSGLCVPHFVIDLPGGGGKLPLLPRNLSKIDNGRLITRDFQGKTASYPLYVEGIS
jgi:lysine 2,3-aminomutase